MNDPGAWGNFVRLDVDYDTTDPDTLFNLTVSEVSPSGTQPVLRTETFRNLTMTTGVTNSAVDVVNEGSRMVQMSSLGAGRPAQTGTVSDVLNSATIWGTAAPFQFNAQLTGDVARTVTLARVPGGSNLKRFCGTHGDYSRPRCEPPTLTIPATPTPQFS